MASASTSQSTKKLYPDGTVFVLHYARKWETLPADNLTNALAARAIKEATLLTEQPSIVAKEPAKRVGIDDAMSVYVSNTAATKKHRRSRGRAPPRGRPSSGFCPAGVGRNTPWSGPQF
jgi:hypothetical protein